MKLTQDSRIYVAGHRGLVGSAMVKSLKNRGFGNLIVSSHKELDLTEQSAVRKFFDDSRPEAVIMAAARVGGIHANNSHPAAFLRDNLLIQDNVIDAAYRSGVAKFVFIKMCQAYRREYGFKAISLMPTNLYGPGDNFDLQSSHVLPALIRKFHEAKLRNDKNVEIWGTGTPRREFLHVEDLADAVLFLLQNYDAEPIVNIGWGEDLTIRELSEIIMSAIGYSGSLTFDHSKPDGTPRKLLDVTRLHSLGWRPRISLRAGIESTYAWFKDHAADARL